MCVEPTENFIVQQILEKNQPFKKQKVQEKERKRKKEKNKREKETQRGDKE